MIHFTILGKKQLIRCLVLIIAAIVVIIIARYFIGIKDSSIQMSALNDEMQEKGNSIMGALEESSVTICMNTVMPKIIINKEEGSNSETDTNYNDRSILSSRRRI